MDSIWICWDVQLQETAAYCHFGREAVTKMLGREPEPSWKNTLKGGSGIHGEKT